MYVCFAIGNVLVSSRLSKLGFINTRWRKKERRFNYIERLAAIRLGSLVPGIFVLLFILVWPPFVVVLLNHLLIGWFDLTCFHRWNICCLECYLLELLPGVLSPWIVAWSVISLNCCLECYLLELLLWVCLIDLLPEVWPLEFMLKLPGNLSLLNDKYLR